MLSSVTKFSRNSNFDIHTIACMTRQNKEEKKKSKLRKKTGGGKEKHKSFKSYKLKRQNSMEGPRQRHWKETDGQAVVKVED